MAFQNKTILIFGGSGSLGNKIISTHIEHNNVINFSRDENKHWQMNLKYATLKHIIGDIRNYDKVESAITRTKPDIIIVAAALKHIDRCEFESEECIQINLNGLKNVLNAVEKYPVSCVCFISTDKACSPVNIYGMTKALCESLMVERSKFIQTKLVSVRYGNVLNSRGSIIPVLNHKGQDPHCDHFSLTHKTMTRFIMTLDESLSLIEYAILEGNTGEIIIPRLKSMYIKDLIEIFSEKYNKPVKMMPIRTGEKFYETLINETQSTRTINKGLYYHILPTYSNVVYNTIFELDSRQDIMKKEDLKQYLEDINLLSYVDLS